MGEKQLFRYPNVCVCVCARTLIRRLRAGVLMTAAAADAARDGPCVLSWPQKGVRCAYSAGPDLLLKKCPRATIYKHR